MDWDLFEFMWPNYPTEKHLFRLLDQHNPVASASFLTKFSVDHTGRIV